MFRRPWLALLDRHILRHPEPAFGVWMKEEGAKPYPTPIPAPPALPKGCRRLGGVPVPLRGVGRGRVPRECHALVMATDPPALTAFLPGGRNNSGRNRSRRGAGREAQVSPRDIGVTTSGPSRLGAHLGLRVHPDGCAAPVSQGRIQGALDLQGGWGAVPKVEGPGIWHRNKSKRAGNALLPPGAAPGPEP